MMVSLNEFLNPLYEKVSHQIMQIESLEAAIKQLKKQNPLSIGKTLAQCQEAIAEKKQQLKCAHIELKYCLKSCNQVLSNALRLKRKSVSVDTM